MTSPPTTTQGAPRTSRCWTLRGTEGTVDVEIVAPDDLRVGELLPLLHRALGVPAAGLWAGPVRLDDALTLSAPALRHGAVLGLDGPAGRPLQWPSPLELRVVGGPDAGRVVPLGRGRLVVGRGQACGVRITDPDISRMHVEVRLGDGAVEVRELGSTNGSMLGGERLDGRFRPWPPGTHLHLGATALTIAGASGPPALVEPAAGGRSRVRPPRVLRAPRAEVDVALPTPPTDAPVRRLAWVAVLLPAAGGGLLAWLLHAPTFLFFALLGPLVAFGSWASDRWSGRRSSRRERSAYREQMATALRRLEEAVRADVRAAEREHPDPATIATAVRRRTAEVWSRGPAGGGPLEVRVGTGPWSSRVTRVEGDGSRRREIADDLPVTVELSATGGLAVVGPRRQVLGTLRAVLAQLTALHSPDGLAVVLLTRPDRLADWAWARWLPHLAPGAVHVDADAGDSRAGGEEALRRQLDAHLRDLAAHPGDRTVVVVDRRLDARTAALLLAGRDAGLVLLTAAEGVPELPVGVDATLALSGETGSSGVLARDGAVDRPAALVDRMSLDVAAELARGLADLVPADSAAALPTEVPLLELGGWAVRPDGQGITGRWPTGRDALRTSLGRTVDGTIDIDLCRDGPHALVAGTTGSGKSELLQALVAGLALNHPPERCSFLLVDYKGGAAFADAARLPHTVGLLTDLDGATTARALRSLTAELTRREALLAEHGVPDISALPAAVDLARLVIVVDEFATLVEELPGFVPGLVGIAQRGRSLGIHLVLATQRPGGVVSPEIRANCTLRICLRTTDESDSRDVIGSGAAAHLPVHVPGRAFVRTGNARPRVVQVARAATAASAETAGPEARRWSWPALDLPTARPSALGVTALSRLVDALADHAARRGAAAPHRPWQPPLPDHLTTDDLDHPTGDGQPDAGSGAVLRIGLIDRPDLQTRHPLVLDLAEGGGVLAVGGPRSGRTTFLRTVLRSATSRLRPDRLHVHVLEAGGGALAAEAAALPHTGTAITGPDALRTVRLLDRLGREIEARRAAPAGGTRPLVLVLVDGVEELGSLLDDAEPGRGSEALLRLVRDGAAVGVTCVLTADRAMPGGRLAAAARLRLVLPLPDRADYALAGVPARVVPGHRPPGRALLGEDARECQLALPGTAAPRTGSRSGTATAAPPVRIVELPADASLPAGPVDGPGWSLTIGPGGDDGQPLSVDLLRAGGLLVLGPAGSGRTTALHAFTRRLGAAGADVARLLPAGACTPDEAADTWLDPADAAALRCWVDGLGGRRGVLVADDLGSPADHPALAALPPLGARSGVALLAAGSAGQLTSHYQGAVAALRRARNGLLLTPGAGDAEALGIRMPRLPLPVRPGSGWLVTDGVPQRVQVARTPAAG